MKGLAILLSLFAVLLFCVQSSWAGENFSVSLNAGYYSKYVGSAGNTIYAKSVFQQSLSATYVPLGVYGCAFHSYSPEGGPNKDWGDELDYGLGISHKINSLIIDFSCSYLDLMKIGETDGNLYALAINLALPINQYSFNIMAEQDLTENQLKPSRLIYRAGGAYSLKLTETQDIKFDLSVSGHDGKEQRKAEPVSSGKLTISSTFKVWGIGITPTISGQKRIGYSTNHGGTTHDELWGGINLGLNL